MKILRIIARLNVGGPARHVVWLTEGLKAQGYETVLVCGVVPPGEVDMTYAAERAGIQPVVIPEMSRELSLKDAVTAWKLFRLMADEHPDIVHTHTAKAGGVGRLAVLMYRWLTPAVFVGKPRRCRVVHTYHGHVFHSYYGPMKTRVFVTIERLLARLATDRIIVVSEQQRREIHQRFRIGRRSQFAVIPLGIDLEIYTNWRERRTRFRDELNAAADEYLIGIVGRLTEVKNHKLFVEAAALLRTISSAPIRFLIIGDGPLRGLLEAEVSKHGLENDFVFLGNRRDPENFYPALDILALTSLNEGTPLSVIEGMANARSVIATSVGGVVNLLGHDLERQEGYTVCERGISVKSRDSLAFARGLKRLIQDESLRRKVGERGLDFVWQNYGRERLFSDMNKLYREIESLSLPSVAQSRMAATDRSG